MIQPKKIFRTKDGKLGFEWSDGTRGTCGIRELRLACPCALCVDEHTGEKLLDDSTVPADIKKSYDKNKPYKLIFGMQCMGGWAGGVQDEGRETRL